MNFTRLISDDLRDTLRKLKKSDLSLFNQVKSKMYEICDSDNITIQRFKNCKNVLKDYKRAHIGHHVLIFRVEGSTVIFEKFEHHDKAY
jgi:mRNA-degrading endonuclease RelE of RelBE toxin-antitoxin system